MFGMGTGVSPPPSPPEAPIEWTIWTGRESKRVVAHPRIVNPMVKPHGHLVPVSFTSYDASTPGLSTSSSSRGL